LQTLWGSRSRPLINAAQGALLAAAILSLTLAPSVGTAQNQGASVSREGLEEVVVTARRREESAQSVPIAITALGGAELEARHIENLEGIQTAVPEFSISQSSGRPNSPVYGLRGIRPTEAIYGQDPTVAVYFADMVISPAEGTNLGLYDLASVQVLKGPQGTLFGRNTTGGALLMTPRRPGRTFGGNVMVSYGNFGRTETQLGLDMPFADKLSMRLAVRSINSDGYQTNVESGPLNGTKLGGESTRDVRLSMVWDITDNLENYTVGSYDRKTTNGRGTVLLAINPASTLRCYDGPANVNNCSAFAVGEPLPSYFDALKRAQSRDVNDVESDMPQFDRIEVWGVVNTTTAKLADTLTLKGIGGYRQFKSASAYDIDASEIPGILTSEGDEELKHASYELQLLGMALDNRLNWVTGLYWYYEDGFQNSPGRVLQGVQASNRNPFMQRASIHNNTYSAFAQGSFNLTSDLSLTAGARWTKDDKQMVITTQTPAACALKDPHGSGATLPLSQCAVPLSKSFSQPTGTLSLDYKLHDDVLLYAASRYGYRAGGFNLRGTDPVSYKPFDPETVVDLELGTKADWLAGDWRMRSNVAVYHQWYNNIQRTVGVTSPAGVPGSAVQNAAKATVFGIELEQTIAPTRNLSLQLNYAFTNPKYKSWTEIGSDPIPGTSPAAYPTVDLSATPFPFTPKHSASATLQYSVPLGRASEELLFSASASYRSNVWINSLQTIAAIRRTPDSILPFLQQSAYTLVDLNASWNGVMRSALDIAVYVKNVTDKEYAVGGIQLYESSYQAISRFGLVTKAFGEPRTFGAEVRYRF
jgi:iron complex outermembrane receptor protein